ncbi:MAG: NusG domain II-containing protein [Spirochaetota bacterium]
MRLKPLDFLIIAVALVATVFVSVAVLGGRDGGISVRISGPDGEWDYPLARDREVKVSGPLGTTLVSIREGRVLVEASPCRNQTCVFAGSIDRGGQWLACLPNRVFVRLEGGARGEALDGATF